MGIEKIKKFIFLNEKDENFTSRWSQILVNVTNPSYLKQKPSNIVYEA